MISSYTVSPITNHSCWCPRCHANYPPLPPRPGSPFDPFDDFCLRFPVIRDLSDYEPISLTDLHLFARRRRRVWTLHDNQIYRARDYFLDNESKLYVSNLFSSRKEAPASQSGGADIKRNSPLYNSNQRCYIPDTPLRHNYRPEHSCMLCEI